jgi:hypothetical protein
MQGLVGLLDEASQAHHETHWPLERTSQRPASCHASSQEPHTNSNEVQQQESHTEYQSVTMLWQHGAELFQASASLNKILSWLFVSTQWL